MPLFEYVCTDCRHQFETFVTSDRPPSCPACHSRVLDKQLSVFAVSTNGREASMPSVAPCGSCGDPRGAGSCRLN